MTRTQQFLIVLVALCSSASLASAEKLMLISDTGTNEVLIESLRASLETAGTEVVAAGSSLQDTVLMLGCEASDNDCLDQVIEMGGVDGLVVVPSAPSMVVVRRGGERLESPRVDPAEPGAVEGALLEMLGLAEPEPVAEPEVISEPRTELVSEPVPHTGSVFDTVKTRTWIVLGSGAAVAGLGLVFFGVASSKQDRVDGHPIDTVADLKALEDLEATGAAYNRAGNIFFIAGSLAVAGGVGLLLWDPDSEASLTLTPTVTGSGAAVTLRWSLR